MAKKIRSIMQDKEAGQCYLCRLLHRDYSIKPARQEHHVMGGTANRKLSEKIRSQGMVGPGPSPLRSGGGT